MQKQGIRCIKNICRRSCLNVKLPLVQNSKSHWSHLILLFLCQIILPVADHSKLHWSHLLVLFTHAFLQITSCVDFKAMLVTFNFTFLRVSPQITCRKGFKVAVVTFEFICFRSIQITSRRTFKVTFSAGILQPIVLGLNVIIQIGCGSCNMFIVITFKFQFFMFCLFMVFEIPLG